MLRNQSTVVAMRNVLLISLLYLSSPDLTQAQSNASMPGGLFRSAEDFRRNELMLAVDCRAQKHKLRLHEFIGKPYVTIIHQRQSYQYAKDSLYGFRDCAGQSYRFVSENDHYPILNPGEPILIYKLVRPPIAKQPGYTKLFFSKDAGAPLQELTVETLKRAFPENHAYHDRLDAQFSNGGDLSAYDPLHRMTKINWLLKESQ